MQVMIMYSIILLNLLSLLIIFNYVNSTPLNPQYKLKHIQHDDPLLEQILDDIRVHIEGNVLREDTYDLYGQYSDTGDALNGLNFKDIYKKLENGEADEKICNLCKTGISLAKGLFQSEETGMSLGNTLCKSIKIYSPRFCTGLVERMVPPLYYILKNTKLNVTEICGALLNSQCMKFYHEELTSNIKFELPIPPKTSTKIPPIGDEKRYRMLHITDIHVDPYYTPGSNSLCNEPLCCRATSEGTNTSAGVWGETNGECDASLPFITKAFEHIKEKHGHEIDFIVWTGDTIAHDVWNTSKVENIRVLKIISELIQKIFPNTKVFPVLGNHEGFPINMYSPPEVSGKHSMGYLYDATAEMWKKWLNTEESQKTFKRGAYYSLMISPKLKVIGLNSVWYRLNFWNAFNPVDPGGQLKWFINELDKSEKEGHYVIIASHISPISDCLHSFIHNYIRIVERYQHIIVGQFHGHTHKEEIGVFYSHNGTKHVPVGVSYIGPSLTTYSYLNPAYRIFTLNGNGMELDYETYYTNIIEANERGPNHEPEWQLEYDSKTSFKLPSLSPQSWSDLLDKMKYDDQLLTKYFNYYHRFSIDYVEKDGSDRRAKEDKIRNCKLIDPFTNN